MVIFHGKLLKKPEVPEGSHIFVLHFQTKQLGSAGFVLNSRKLPPQGDGVGWFLQAISDKKWRCFGMLGLPHNSSF